MDETPRFRKWFESEKQGVIVLSLGPGDLLLESIEAVAKEAHIHTGAIVSGLGSLQRALFHTLGNHQELDEPLEIIGLTGAIANYEPHIHLTLSDRSGKFYGGHLKGGCLIATVAEIAILRLPDLQLIRRARNGSRISLLDCE